MSRQYRRVNVCVFVPDFPADVHRHGVGVVNAVRSAYGTLRGNPQDRILRLGYESSLNDAVGEITGLLSGVDTEGGHGYLKYAAHEPWLLVIATDFKAVDRLTLITQLNELVECGDVCVVLVPVGAYDKALAESIRSSMDGQLDVLVPDELADRSRAYRHVGLWAERRSS